MTKRRRNMPMPEQTEAVKEQEHIDVGTIEQPADAAESPVSAAESPVSAAKSMHDIVNIVRQKATRIEYSGHTMYVNKRGIDYVMAYAHTGEDSILIVYLDNTRKYMSIADGTADAEELQNVFDIISE